MDPGDLYSHAALIPQLHMSLGDLDGDGWTDQEELSGRGDVSRGITVPRPDDPLGTGLPDPRFTDVTGAEAVDPAAATTVVPDLAPGLGDDPTGSSRYDATTSAGDGGHGPDGDGASAPAPAPEGHEDDPAFEGVDGHDPYLPDGSYDDGLINPYADDPVTDHAPVEGAVDDAGAAAEPYDDDGDAYDDTGLADDAYSDASAY